jgi:hypothetical protein
MASALRFKGRLLVAQLPQYEENTRDQRHSIRNSLDTSFIDRLSIISQCRTIHDLCDQINGRGLQQEIPAMQNNAKARKDNLLSIPYGFSLSDRTKTSYDSLLRDILKNNRL